MRRFQPWDTPLHEDANAAPEEGRGLRYLVRFLNRAYTKLVETELRKHVDMTYAQWSFIRVLCDEDGLSQRELSERNGLMENTTLVALNLMEKRGWVRRQRDRRDKRRLLVYLTNEGRAFGRLQPLVEGVGRVAISNISAETIVITRQTLRQMMANLENALVSNSAAPAKPRASAMDKESSRSKTTSPRQSARGRAQAPTLARARTRHGTPTS